MFFRFWLFLAGKRRHKSPAKFGFSILGYMMMVLKELTTRISKVKNVLKYPYPLQRYSVLKFEFPAIFLLFLVTTWRKIGWRDLLLLLYYFAKPVQHHAKDPYIKVDHNTGVYDPYSLRTVCGFFNVPQY